MCQALQSANQGLTFALERGLEAFWLQQCRDRVCGPAAALSIPLTPVSSRLPQALLSRVWGAASSRLRAQEAETGARPQPWPRLGLRVVTHRVAVWLGLCSVQRGLTHSSPTVKRGRLVLLPVIYSGILSTAGSV